MAPDRLLISMLNPLVLLLLAPLGPSSIQVESAENNAKVVREDAFSQQHEASRELPKWIAKKPPEVKIRMVELDAPVPRLSWPGGLKAAVEVSKGDSWRLFIHMPIDPLLGCPGLTRAAVRRQVFGAASQARAMERGGEPEKLEEWSLSNPLIAAMASHWAGTLAMEIDFVLKSNLADDGALAALLAPVRYPAPGHVSPPTQDRHSDDLTWKLLVHMVAPDEKDAKLEWIYSALEKGQPLENALEKATRKPPEKLDGALAEHFEEYLHERFPRELRDAYRAARSAYEAKEWEKCLDLLSQKEMRKKATPFLSDSMIVMFDSALLGLGRETSVNELERMANLFTEDSPAALEGMRQLAGFLKERDKKDDSRRVLELMKLRYGWVAGVREEADAGIEALGR